MSKEKNKETIVYEAIRDSGENIGKMLEYFYKENLLEAYKAKEKVIEISKEYFSAKEFDEVKSKKQLSDSLTSLFIKPDEKKIDANCDANELKDCLEKFMVDAKKILKHAKNAKEAEFIFSTNICIPDDEQFKKDYKLYRFWNKLSQIYPVEPKYIIFKITQMELYEKQESDKSKSDKSK